MIHMNNMLADSLLIMLVVMFASYLLGEVHKNLSFDVNNKGYH